MLRSKMFILAIAVLLSMPTFALAWGGKGDFEPDTAADRSGGFMQQGNPPGGPGGKEFVYFSAFAGTNGYLQGSTSFNTNFATLGSKIQGYPYQVYAMLGAWKDCNGDGFIGFADNGLFEYRSELLVGPYDTGNCPATPLPSGTVHQFPHNDGVWVHELLPIGWDTGAGFENNALNLNDSAARVWGDWGLPGDAPGGQCFVRPWPYGSVHSPGGLLKHLDCFASNRVGSTILVATDATGTTSTYNDVMSTQPWGDETDDSMVTVWDCGQPQVANEHPAGNVYANVSQPGTNPDPNTGGSLSGTANSTAAGFDRCDRRTDVTQGGLGGQAASAPYVPGTLESDVQDQVAVRFVTDQTLFYSEGSRPAAPFTLITQVPGVRWTPGDGGTRATGSEGLWVGNSVTAASRNPYVSRQDLGLSKVTYTTYYASVSDAAASRYNLQLPSSTVGIYGAEACGSVQTGIVNGWDCDATHWWPNNADGTSTMPTATIGAANGLNNVPVGARIGATYNLRDIDCYDTSITALRDNGIGYGLVSGSAGCN